MKIIHIARKGRMLSTLESFHIYKETKTENQINDKLTTKKNVIFETIMQQDPKEAYAAPRLQNTPVKIAQLCETIHLGRKEGTVQKGQKPNPIHRHSEGPFHILV